MKKKIAFILIAGMAFCVNAARIRIWYELGPQPEVNWCAVYEPDEYYNSFVQFPSGSWRYRVHIEGLQGFWPSAAQYDIEYNDGDGTGWHFISGTPRHEGRWFYEDFPIETLNRHFRLFCNGQYYYPPNSFHESNSLAID